MMSTRKDPRSIPNRHTWRRAVVLLTVAGLAVAACGSDDDSADDTTAGTAAAEATSDTTAGTAAEGTTAEGTGETPTGEPLKIMTVTTLNAAGPTYENIANTANLYADWVNARGGIA